MNTPLFPVAIYPSQLDAFKTKAELLSTSISETFSIKKLSAFKRNDYLSIALGYKGHPDLVESSKFRVSSDEEQQLLIFSNEAIKKSIAEVFSAKLDGITDRQIQSLFIELEKTELGGMMLKELRNVFANTSPEEAQIILGNANQSMIMKTKEPSFPIFTDEFHEHPNEVSEKFMRDNSAPDPATKRKEFKRTIESAFNDYDVILLTGEAGVGKTIALSEVMPKNNIIDKSQLAKRGLDVKLNKEDFDLVKNSSGGVCAIDEAQILSQVDILRLVDLASKNKAKLIITTQVLENIPVQLIYNYFKLNNAHMTNLHIYKLGHINESIMTFHNQPEENKKLGKKIHTVISQKPEDMPEVSMSDVIQDKIEKGEAIIINTPANVSSDTQKTLNKLNQSLVSKGAKIIETKSDNSAKLWNEQDMKKHVDIIGQGKGKSQIAVNLEQTLFAPVLTDSSLKDLVLMVESRWPEGATCATQECDGEILFWSAPLAEVVAARKQADLEEGLIPLIGLGQQVHANYYEINEQAYVAFDWKTAVVTL